jgi:hypothetical protein
MLSIQKQKNPPFFTAIERRKKWQPKTEEEWFDALLFNAIELTAWEVNVYGEDYSVNEIWERLTTHINFNELPTNVKHTFVHLFKNMNAYKKAFQHFKQQTLANTYTSLVWKGLTTSVIGMLLAVKYNTLYPLILTAMGTTALVYGYKRVNEEDKEQLDYITFILGLEQEFENRGVNSINIPYTHQCLAAMAEKIEKV